MPNDDATNAAMWNTAGQVATTAANVMSTSRWNKKTAKWNEENRDIQRNWALQDWNMQNEYNAPKNVRKRMLEAGMNAALMYGAGASGGASAPVRTTQTPQWNPKTPEYNLNVGSSIMTYLGVQKQMAELENLKLQNELISERTNTQKATTALTWDRAKFTETQNQQLQQIVSAIDNYAVENPRANGIQGNYLVEKMNLDIQTKTQNLMIAAAANVRAEDKNKVTMNQILAQTVHEYTKNLKDQAEIGRINAQVDLIQKSGILLQFDINAAEILNRRFDGPAGKTISAILQKLLK